MNFKEEIIKYENTNYEMPYIVKIGLVPVILTVPYDIKQIKSDGKIKMLESFIKSIVQYTANNTNASFLIKTKVDANLEEKENFKDILLYLIKKNNIKLLIDIHVSLKEKNFDIEISNNLSLDYTMIEELKDIFEEENMVLFKGKVLTKSIYDNIDVIQIELNQKYIGYNDMENIQKICNALVKFINRYTN